MARKPIVLTSFRAGVFDLDGVVTRTAKLHEASWKQLFDDFLRQRATATGDAFRPFEASDYRHYVDGKPRYAGVRSFLDARGISLEDGAPDDPPERETIHGLGKRKNILFHESLQRDGVEVYTSSVALLRRMRSAGFKLALVSSSRNAAAVLDAAGLTALFDVRVDGIVAADEGLKGKPDPDIFLRACALVGVAPADAFAVEDALSGVAAAKAARFGLVVGVDRSGQREALLAGGADLVVDDLAELDAGGIPLPDALERYEEIERRLAGKRMALFLDYDGTLTPIVDRPELALLGEEVRETIRQLARVSTVAIVSGRDRADVTQRVGLDALVYAGSHGFDIAGPNGLRMTHPRAADFLPALDRAEARLRALLAPVPGTIVERKRFAIAVHFRLVGGRDVSAVEHAVAEALREAPELQRSGGKMIHELRPRLPWDKGRAVCWLLEALELDQAGVVTLYVGDDETDEDAFRITCERGDIGVLVASAPLATLADYRLSDPDAVATFLRKLLAASEVADE